MAAKSRTIYLPGSTYGIDNFVLRLPSKSPASILDYAVDLGNQILPGTSCVSFDYAIGSLADLQLTLPTCAGTQIAFVLSKGTLEVDYGIEFSVRLSTGLILVFDVYIFLSAIGLEAIIPAIAMGIQGVQGISGPPGPQGPPGDVVFGFIDLGVY